MKKLIAFTSAALAATAVFAAPVVSDVTMTQDAGKTVNITYKLTGEPGIVTVDIQTNGPNGWVSIGGEHLTYFAGDANKVVQPTGENETRKITWKPRKAWPDNEVTENVKAVLSAWSLDAPPDYMAISLTVPNTVLFYTDGAVPFGVENDMYKTDWMLMRKCPAANVAWRMGSPAKEEGRTAASEVPHLVALTNDFYVGVYLVTQRQYFLMTGEKPSKYVDFEDSAMHPMQGCTYEEIRGKAKDGYDWPKNNHEVIGTGFIGLLRKHSGLNELDLPTDAQWEFACRAGCGAALYNGKELAKGTATSDVNLEPLAHYGTKATTTAKVGSYESNAWGIYDMYGNVWEFCLDWWLPDISAVDPEKGPLSNSENRRVVRGGRHGASFAVSNFRSARRDNAYSYNPSERYGFRLACKAELK